MLFFSILSNLLLNISIALSKPMLPMITMAIGIALKCVLNVYLVSTLGMGVIGAAVSSIIAYLVIFVINLYYIKKTFGIRLNVTSVFVKPIISALAMLVACEAAFWAVTHVMKEGRLSTLVVLMVGGIAYPVALLLFKGINPDEMAELPGAARFSKFFGKSRKAGA